MNLEEWEQSNNKLVKKMQSFYEEYQEKFSSEFNRDWVKANKVMCEKAAKKFKKEIKNQVSEITLIH